MLVHLLRIITFALVKLWSLLTRLIFNAIAYLIVLFIQAFKAPGEATHEGFQQVAEAIRGCFNLLFQLVGEAMNFVISTVFDIVKDSITGSVAVTGSAIGGLAEKLMTSLEEAVNQVSGLFEELSDMVSQMASELWNNYKDAVGYVAENA